MPHQKSSPLLLTTALPHFSQWLQKQGLGHKTVVNYVSDLRRFTQWQAATHPSLTATDLTLENVQEYCAAEQTAGITLSTLERRLSALRKFEEFLSSVHHINRSFTPSANPSTPTQPEVACTKLLHRFALALLAEGCKEVTVQNYVLDIELFAKWGAPAFLASLCTKPKVAEYLASLKATGQSSATTDRKLASIKRFCEWAAKDGVIAHNPFQPVRQVVQNTFRPPLSLFEKPITATPKQKRTLGTLFQWYNNSRLASYLHLSVLIIFAVVIGVFGYQQFFSEVSQQYAYPSEPTRPGRRLSFQGRLTDSSATPITTPIAFQFRLFNAKEDGTALWSGSCTLDPDGDGIFSTVLGDPTDGCGNEIPDDVFSQNSEIWLEVQVSTETLTPRQRIASVGYALNSETLQGFPPSLQGTINTIPVINALGELIIGAENPRLIASSGAFLVQGESITLQTETGTQGDITFAPDAGGTVIINSGTTSQDSLYLSNANLTNGNLIHGYVGNDTSTGNLLYLTAGSTEQEKFSVSTRGDINVSRAATIGGSLNVDSGTLFVDEINNRVGIGTATPDKKLEIYDNSGNAQLRLTNTDATQFAEFGVDNAGSLLLATTGTTGNITLDAVSNLYFSDARATNIPLTVSDSTINANLGQGIIDAINDVYTAAVSNTGLWNITSGALYPKNLTADLLLGATSTASAKFAFTNLNAGTPTFAVASTGQIVFGGDSNLYRASANTLKTDDNLLLGADPTASISAIAREYVESRGQNLVTNGSGLMGNNYNFSGFTYSQNEVHGGMGSFLANTTATSKLTDEFIPVDPEKYYRLVGWAKSGDTGGANFNPANRQYFGIGEFDIDGNSIQPYHVMKFTGSTDTTLAAPLNPGDTTVTLTDATGWQNAGQGYERNFLWYGYTNSKGYTYPNYTYTRYYAGLYQADWATNGVWAAGGISGNVITLRSPWTGPALSAGAAVRNGSSGGGYKYIAASNVIVPNAWTRYEGYIGTLETNGAYSSVQFRQGTAYVKILFLTNYHNVADNNIRWSDVWFSEMSSRNLEVATTTVPGVVSTTTQSFGGDKSFAGTVTHLGNTIIGDAAADTTTIHSAAWTFSADTNFALSGGVNGLSFDTDTLSIDATNNRVGIGTTAPNSPLHIVKGTGDQTMLELQNTGAATGDKARLKFSMTSVAGAGGAEIVAERLGANAQSALQFYTNSVAGTSTERMRLDQYGNVGIGTTGPDAKLDVLGTTTQMRLSYADGTTYTDFTTDSGGDLTIAPSGGDMNITGTITASGLGTFAGANLGYTSTAPVATSVLTNAWIPRKADNSNFIMMDYQDEAAYWDQRYDSISITPSPNAGGTASIFRDDSNTITWNAGTSPSPIVIEVDSTTNPITAKNNGSYQVGLTFRSSGASNPTHIKIEAWDTASSAYTTMYDADTTIAGDYAYWLSPKFTAPAGTGPTYHLYKVKVTLTVPGALPGAFRLQRFMVYHDTATWDPWHLGIGGGSLYGNVTSTGDLALNGGDLTSTGNLAISASGELSLSDSRTGNIPLSVSDTDLNLFAAGDRGIIDALNYLYGQIGSVGGGSSSNFWGNVADGTYLNDTLQSLLIGGNSSASAKFRVDGSNGNIITAGDLALNGGDVTSTGNLAISASGELYLSDTRTGNIPLSLTTTNLDMFDVGNRSILDALAYLYSKVGSGMGTFLWSNTTEGTYLNDTLQSLLIGGNSSASAKFRVDGVTGDAILTGGIQAQGSSIFNLLNSTASLFNIRGGNDNDLFVVDPLTNSVGVGTATPGAKLHVRQGIGGSNVLIGDTGTNSALGAIGFASSLASTNYALQGDISNTRLNAPTGYISFRTANTERMQLTSAGNLKLGSGAPDTQLFNLGGVGSTNGINFGGDTLLYRHADHASLKTDNTFIAAGLAIGKDTLDTGYEVDVTGDVQFSGQVKLGNIDITTNPTGLGSGALLYGTNDSRVYYYDGVQWVGLVAASDAGGFYLNDVDKVVYPKNVTYDLLLGGTSTASAKFRVDATDGSLTSTGNATFSGTGVFGGQIRLGNAAADPTAIGSGSLYYNTTENRVYFYNGNQWVAFGDASMESPWFLNTETGVLHPKNVNPDLIFGGYSTASAKFRVNATTGNTWMQGAASASAYMINQGQHRIYNLTETYLSQTYENLIIDSTGERVIIQPDIQIAGGDIIGPGGPSPYDRGDIRISLYDDLDMTKIFGLLNVEGTQKLYDLNTQIGDLYTYETSLDKTWTTSQDFNLLGTASSSGILQPATNNELKLATTEDLTNKTWTSSADFNDPTANFTSGILNPAANNELALTTTFSTPSGLAGWEHRMALSATASGNLTDHQVSVTVDTAALIAAGKMRSDCADIRLTTDSGTTLMSHLIEKGCNTSSTVIWFKAASLSTTPTTFYLYYGNQAAEDTQSGEGVFELYDGFSSNGIDTTKWTFPDSSSATGLSISTNDELALTNNQGKIHSIATFSDGVIFETRYKVTTTPTYGTMMGFWAATNNHYGINDYHQTADYSWSNGTSATTGSHQLINGSDSLVRIAVPNNTQVVYSILNYTSGATVTGPTTVTNTVSGEKIRLGRRFNDDSYYGYTGNVSWDWVRVRKYTATEPIVTVGAESNGVYTSGEQTWTSSPVDAGNGNTFRPSRFTATWQLDGTDNIIPKFQLIGANQADFSDATTYPGASTYFQDGSAYDLNSGVERNISADVTTPKRYWKVKAYFETGATTSDTPKILDMSISGQGQYAGGDQYWRSNVFSSGSDINLFRPNRFKASWDLAGENSYVRFQIWGSDTGAFSTEHIIYPATGKYYVDNSGVPGDVDINNGEYLDLGPSIAANQTHKYWRVVAFMSTGSDGGDTPKIYDIQIQEEHPLILNKFGQKVGVGTASPSAALHVMGSGTADYFKVSSTSADFFRVKADGDSVFGGLTKNDVNLQLYGDLVQMSDTTLRSGLTNVVASYLYDTTRDSDGGNWRKSSVSRSLSWYTESRDDGVGDTCSLTLDDRCGRQDFPAKANLIVTTSALYIFDASNNQMWMKFAQGNGFALGTDSNNNPTSVTAKDGAIYVGTTGTDSSAGIYEFDFKTDTMAYWNTSSRTESNQKIEKRNSANQFNQNSNTAFALSNNQVNDLDISYYQNRRYLAAATDSGVNLINLDYVTNYEFFHSAGPDDGTITDDGNASAPASRAFDNDDGVSVTYVRSDAADNALTVTYQFNSPKVIRRYALVADDADLNEAPSAWKLFASDDGSNWTELDDKSGITNWVDIGNTSDTKFFSLNNDEPYTYYKLVVSDVVNGSNDQVRIANIYYQERQPVSAIRQYNTNALIPKTTASSMDAAQYNVLNDRRRDKVWRSAIYGRFGWVQLHYPTPIVATKYSITAYSTAARKPTAWRFMGSNDGAEWTTLDTQSGQSLGTYIRTTYNVTNSTAYKFYRLKIDAVASDTSYVEVAEFDINGPSISASGTNGSANETTNDETNVYFQDQITTGYYWLSATGQANTATLTYDYGANNKQTFNSYSVRGYVTNTRAMRSWKLQGSVDCTTYTDLHTYTHPGAGTPFTSAVKRLTYSFSNTTAYQCYRLQVVANNGDASYVDLREFTLGQQTVEANGERDNGADGFSERALWDGLITSEWHSLVTDTTGDITAQFAPERTPIVTGVVLTGASTTARSIRDFTLLASNDRSTWTTFVVRNFDPMTTTSERKVYTFSNTTPYRYWKLDIDANNGDANYASLNELELMGSKYNNVRFNGNSLVATNVTTGDLSVFNDIWSDTTAQSQPDTTLSANAQNDYLASRQPNLSANVTNTKYALEANEGVVYYGSSRGMDTLANVPFEGTAQNALTIRATSAYTSNQIVANRFNLRHYWPFEETEGQTTFTDYGTGGADSFFQLNTTNHAPPVSTSSGVIGRAYTFDRASTQHHIVDDSDIGELDLGDGQYSVGAWINPTSTTGVSRMIMGTVYTYSCDTNSDSVVGTCYSGWYLQLAADNANRVSWIGCSQTEGGGCPYGFTTDAGDITLGAWNHVVVRRDSAGTALFINGTKVYTTSAVAVTDGASLYIGTGGAQYVANTYHFDGTIDEPFIASRGLTDEEVRAMYRYGASQLEINNTTADIYTQRTIGSTTANWELNQFRGRVVEIIDGVGSGQTRLVTKNSATTLEVAPVWTTTPGADSVFRVLPYNIPGSITNTKAIRVDQENVFLGLNDQANGGGVVRLRRSDETVTDYYHADAGKTDDHGTAWDNTSGYDNVVGISTTQDNLLIAAENQVWQEKVGDSLLESIDKLQQAYSSALLDSSTQRAGGANELNGGPQVIRKGWGYIKGDETAKNVYFGSTFVDTPLLFISQAGVLNSGQPVALEDCSYQGADYTRIAGTRVNKDGFVVTEVGGSTSYYYCFTWMAIGQAKSALPEGTFSGGADLAEWYGTDDETLAAAEVVSVAASGDIKVARSTEPQDSKAIGIIATQPSITMGLQSGLTPGYKNDPQLTAGAKTAVQVALAGRVPLKVSLENGPILPGDYLTSSSVPGVAAKAIKAGPTIGKALEAFDGKSTIVAYGKQDAPLEPALELLKNQAVNSEVAIDALSGEPLSQAAESTPSSTLAESILAPETFSELDDGQGTIMTFVNTSYFDPNYASSSATATSNPGGNYAIDSSGKLVALGQFSFDLVDQVRSAVFPTALTDEFGGVASSSAVATSSGQFVASEEDVMAAALARLQNLGSLALRELNVAKLRVLDTLFAKKIETDDLAAEVTRTDLLAPLSQADMVVQLGGTEATPSGQFIVLNKAGEQVAAIDGSGNIRSSAMVAQEMEARFIQAGEYLSVTGDASVSGQLVANSARIEQLQSNQAQLAALQTNDATISGTLYANNIAGLEERVRNLVARERAEAIPASASALVADKNTTDLLAQLIDQPANTTTDEFGTVAEDAPRPAITAADLSAIEGDVQLSGTLMATNLSVESLLSVGRTTLTTNSLAFSLDAECVESDIFCNTFSILPSGTGRLDLLASTVIISKDGGVEINSNVEINGNLAVKDSLFASLIQPQAGKSLEVKLASTSENENEVIPSELVVRGLNDQEVAAFSASGSARFQKLIIAAQEATPEADTVETSVTTNSTTGTGTLAANSTQFVIRNSQIQAGSLVYLTPTSPTKNHVIYVASRQVDNPETPENEGHFIVAIDSAIDTNITFNWWIIN